MPTQQTRYAGPMVLKKISKAQLERLRGAVKAEGSKIVYVLMRVKETHEPQLSPGMGGERKYTVWVCAKAAKQLSVCMWARQMGLHCLHADDIFPNTERAESEKVHAEAFHLAVREAKTQDELDYEEYASVPEMTCKKQPVSESVEIDPPSYESKQEGAEGKSPRAAPDMDTQQGAVKPAPSTDITPQQKHPDNIDESLLFIFSMLRRYDDDETELNARSPAQAWKHMQKAGLDVLRFQKKKPCKETWLPTLVKAFKTHVFANDEWRKFADKRMEKARRKGEIADAAEDGKAKVEEEFVEGAQCDEVASKRQKCVDGNVTSAPTGGGGCEPSKNKDEEGNEELLAYLLDQRRFDDGEELGSREAKDVWTHLQTCADRWYTSHMQEPRKAEHQMTLVKAMRGHPMRTDGWGGTHLPCLAPFLSLSQLLTLGLERGMYHGLRRRCAVGPAIHPPTRAPTQAHGDLTALPLAASRPARRGAFGSAASVSHPILSGPSKFSGCTCIPLRLSTSPILLSVQRVARPKSTSWFPSWLTRQDQSWTPFVGPNAPSSSTVTSTAGLGRGPGAGVVEAATAAGEGEGRENSGNFRRSCPLRSVRTALPPAACPPASCDTGRAPVGRAGLFMTPPSNIRGRTTCSKKG